MIRVCPQLSFHLCLPVLGATDAVKASQNRTVYSTLGVGEAHSGCHGSVVLCSLQRSAEAKETVWNRMRSLKPKEHSHIKLNNQCSTKDGSAPVNEFNASFAPRIKNDRCLAVG
jgi:hypothetical protein